MILEIHKVLEQFSNFTHSDLKDNNILCIYNKETYFITHIYLIDFGVSKYNNLQTTIYTQYVNGYYKNSDISFFILSLCYFHTRTNDIYWYQNCIL